MSDLEGRLDSRMGALAGRAMATLDGLLQLARSDAWNGSFKLDELLNDAREIVTVARDGGSDVLTRGSLATEDAERILVLSDGETWESFDPTKVEILDLSQEAFDALCDGRRLAQLDERLILHRRSLAEAAFGEKALLRAPAQMTAQEICTVLGLKLDPASTNENAAAFEALQEKFAEDWQNAVIHGDTHDGLLDYAQSHIEAALEDAAERPSP